MRRLTGITAAVLAGALGLAAGALAQESKSKGTGSEAAKSKKPAKSAEQMQQAAMEAMTKAGTPGEAHKKLEPFVGTFDTKVKAWMDPSKPPEESTGTSENSWVLGNRFVQMKYEGTFMGQPFSGIGYTGYDNVAKKYVGTWMDSMSTGVLETTGTADASGKNVTMAGKMADPMTGKTASVREKITVADNDHHTFEMWGPDPSGKMYKVMEITYTRKK